MSDFLDVLIKRYRDELVSAQMTPESSISDNTTTDLKHSLSSLLLAQSALKKVELCEKYPDHPAQVVVIGPTQVGKSSMVNLLIGQELAEASATAGFTVHCQGYGIDIARVAGNNIADSWLGSYFDGLESQEQAKLDRRLLNEYSFTELSGTDQLPYDNTVIWDTPDFDSVDSYGYREPVLQAIALADLVIFVVSKEKYADKTVWDMLSMLTALSKPFFIVMNKTPTDVRTQLASSVEKKYERLDNADKPEIFFIDEYQQVLTQAQGTTELTRLQSAIVDKVSAGRSSRLAEHAGNFVNDYWTQWTAPVAADHHVQAQWRQMVDDMTVELCDRYKSEYLEHSRYKETFQLALAELLTLLEVPGMAEPLSRLRSVVTWPMRKLIATASQAQNDKTVVRDERSEERRLLEELGAHGLSQLGNSLAEKDAGNAHWAGVRERLGHNRSDLIKAYHNGLDNYQTLLQVEIERAAQSLYRRLQEQPATLNSLRAARVTGDAAAVVLAVKSGGLGAADLVIAPAMLSLTSMLTEGALGQYMQKVQSDLRIYQEREVSAVMARKLKVKLYPLIHTGDRSKTISPEQLKNAADQLGIDLAANPADEATKQMSERRIRELYAEAEEFSQQLISGGWSEGRRTEVIDTRSASELFADNGADRPLVVGLFGGTGVGKSSLLNRLAGSDIARTGVVRPTSMEITAYLHRDRQTTSLPAGFPADRFSEVKHDNEKFTDVMWVDMPDFDSEETQNRDQVAGWLPHIDLLLYVVTPERYKDEEGWRLLIQNGYRHAWLFVMNQWDKGEEIQLVDFRKLLSTAGFDSPLLYRTVCGDKTAQHPQDEFDQLADFVAKLAQRNIVTQLEQRGWLQRLDKAKARLHRQMSVLQNAGQELTVRQSFERHWAEFCDSAKANLDLPLREYSELFNENKTAPLASALKSLTGVGKGASPQQEVNATAARRFSGKQ